jgi:hypothetical protein
VVYLKRFSPQHSCPRTTDRSTLHSLRSVVQEVSLKRDCVLITGRVRDVLHPIDQASRRSKVVEGPARG